ncbi:MAG: hypothetical protein AB4040_07035 [Synechococcus sp.]
MMKIETVIDQAFATGVFLECHRKAILLLLESGKFSIQDIEAISSLQAAVHTGEIKNLSVTQVTEDSSYN